VRNAGIPVIIEFVKSTNAAVTVGLKEQATRLLCYMCFYNNKNQELIGTPAVASAIVENLALDSKRLQYYTEGLIWSLAHNSKKRRATLVDAGAIGALLEVTFQPSFGVVVCPVLTVRRSPAGAIAVGGRGQGRRVGQAGPRQEVKKTHVKRIPFTPKHPTNKPKTAFHHHNHPKNVPPRTLRATQPIDATS
jgi:hypothetical protein